MTEGTAARDAMIEALEQTIGHMIERRTLDRGGRLPTERALADEFGASRHAIRQALDRLQSKGRLWRHVGRGTFVGRRPDPDLTEPEGGIRHSNPREIVESRQMLEPQMAAAAAAQATPAQIAAIEDAYRRCAAARNMDSYEEWDEQFHRAVAAGTGNTLLRAVFELVNRARKEIVWGTMRRAILRPERREFFSEQHARIVEAIAARNAEAAWQAMQAHVATIADVYAAVQQAPARGPITI